MACHSSGQAYSASSNGGSTIEAIRERWSDGVPAEITNQIKQERALIDAFLKKKIPSHGWIAEDVGDQTFEKETLARAKQDLKDQITDDALNDSNVWDIQYSDGKIVRANDVLAQGGKVKMTGIKAIINSNEESTMFAGKVQFSSMLEDEAKDYLSQVKSGKGLLALPHEPWAGYGSDWRVDFIYE